MFIRVWKEFDLDEVEKHLLVVGDVFGDCGACKELGLDWASIKECPHCHTAFRYIAIRQLSEKGDERTFGIQRILKKRPDLVFIDYSDFKRMSGKEKAHRFFQE